MNIIKRSRSKFKTNIDINKQTKENRFTGEEQGNKRPDNRIIKTRTRFADKKPKTAANNNLLIIRRIVITSYYIYINLQKLKAKTNCKYAFGTKIIKEPNESSFYIQCFKFCK